MGVGERRPALGRRGHHDWAVWELLSPWRSDPKKKAAHRTSRESLTAYTYHLLSLRITFGLLSLRITFGLLSLRITFGLLSLRITFFH